MKKQLLIVAATVWVATNILAETSLERMNTFKNFKMLVAQPTNIFENQEVMDNFYAAANDADKKIDNALNTNKSDTLKNIHKKMGAAVVRIHNLLDQFSVHFEGMKNDAATLAGFKTSVKNFSKERDSLKNEIAAVKAFKLQNQKERSGEAMAAKQRIADMLIDYAQTFIAVAQKAINDFAALDAAFARKGMEQNKKPSKPAKPRTWVRGELPTEPIPAEEMKQHDSDVWSDWDSDLGSDSESE